MHPLDTPSQHTLSTHINTPSRHLSIFQVIMDMADIIIEDFLYQNAFSKYDYMCPLAKSIGMLKCIITLYEEAQKAIADSPPGD